MVSVTIGAATHILHDLAPGGLTAGDLEVAAVACLTDQALDVVPALQFCAEMCSLIHYSKPQCNFCCASKQNRCPAPDKYQAVCSRRYQWGQVHIHGDLLPVWSGLALFRPVSEAIYRGNNIVAL
jgi:hypothetical protein